MSVLILSLLFTLALSGDIDVANYDRVVVIISVKPAPATIQDILDPKHASWKASGFNTSAEIDQFILSTNNNFIAKYGFDFFAQGVTVDANTGMRIITNSAGQPIVTWVPYKFQLPSYRIVVDTENKQRGGEFWHVVNYGVIAQFSLPGRFPGGEAINTSYYPFDIISKNRYHLVKAGENWLDTKYNERFDIFSEHPARQVPNSHTDILGWSHSHITIVNEKIVDVNGNVGCSQITTNTFPDHSNTSSRVTVISHVSRWPCNGKNPVALNRRRSFNGVGDIVLPQRFEHLLQSSF